MKKLIGKSKDGRFHTGPSAAYPAGLCMFLAQLMASVLRNGGGELRIGQVSKPTISDIVAEFQRLILNKSSVQTFRKMIYSKNSRQTFNKRTRLWNRWNIPSHLHHLIWAKGCPVLRRMLDDPYGSSGQVVRLSC